MTIIITGLAFTLIGSALTYVTLSITQPKKKDNKNKITN